MGRVMGLFSGLREVAGSATQVWVDGFPDSAAPVCTAHNERGIYAVVVLGTLPPELWLPRQMWFKGFLGSVGYHDWVDGSVIGVPLHEQYRRQQALVIAVAISADMARRFADVAIKHAKATRNPNMIGAW